MNKEEQRYLDAYKKTAREGIHNQADAVYANVIGISNGDISNFTTNNQFSTLLHSAMTKIDSDYNGDMALYCKKLYGTIRDDARCSKVTKVINLIETELLDNLEHVGYSEAKSGTGNYLADIITDNESPTKPNAHSFFKGGD